MLVAQRNHVIKLAKSNSWKEMNSQDWKVIFDICKDSLPKRSALVADSLTGAVTRQSFFDQTGMTEQELIKLLKPILKKKGVI